MGEAIEKKRDVKLDILRGFAAIIVVIGHVLQRFSGTDSSLLFNVIFSIQMPLFMMISGYARNYSKPIDSFRILCTHIKKRCLSILIPWAAWSLIGCLLLWKLPILNYIKAAAFQMEIAFWFLFSLFTIDVIFSAGEFISRRFLNVEIPRNLLHIVVSGGGIGLLLVIGRYVGMSFLGIKYSCYYAVYFFAGYYLFKILHMQEKTWLRVIIKWASLPCLALYGYLITRYNIFTLPDSSWYVVLRIGISTIGCLIAFFVVDGVPLVREESSATRMLKKVGSYTLEIYVVHYFVVRMLDCKSYNINAIDGMALAVIYTTLVLSLTCGIIWALNQLEIIRTVMFGKRYRS